jgi:hypothetical protein
MIASTSREGSPRSPTPMMVFWTTFARGASEVYFLAISASSGFAPGCTVL